MAGHHRPGKAPVTTCVVVWIEIALLSTNLLASNSHHLRGGVD